ncbi:hypothetical protein [Rhizobium ruizarguesonis]|uniref:hypothetical protein n=1 Tax=Rhizobium ruizarguesonis TaxID=2081791 RepID=UPI001CF52607|nr:hypothetical protein [Rhizobium ruizarguesonis]MCB2403557.1 hypothetical protein [Rhizobium ruizarguesonis]
MTIKIKVFEDDNGDEYEMYCVEIDGDEQCYENRNDAEEALENSKPKGPKPGGFGG